MTEIKNCPFCGSSNVKNYNLLGNDTDYAVACRNCGAEGPDKETEPEAIKAWNTRAPTRTKLVPPVRQPRYDDVYYAGLAELDEPEDEE